MLLIPHSEARYFYLSILIGPNNEFRRADSLILLQPSINSCFHLKNKYSCSGNNSGFFLFSGLSLHILWFKISSKIWKIYGIDAFSTYFLVAHHTNNFEHIWFEEKKLKSMMPLGWQASEVLTVCIKYVAQSSRDAGWITIWYFIFLSDFNAIKPPPFW